MKKSPPSLPAHRAFVIQLHADARPEDGQLRGRVEHLVSHHTAHFASLEELRAFMQRVLATQEAS